MLPLTCSLPRSALEYLRRLQRSILREDGAQLERCLSMDPGVIPGGHRFLDSEISDVSHEEHLSVDINTVPQLFTSQGLSHDVASSRHAYQHLH